MRRYLTFFFFFFNDTATTEIYTLSLHDALPISLSQAIGGRPVQFAADCVGAEAERIVNALKAGDVALLENLRFHPDRKSTRLNSSHGYISYAVFCLKKKKKHTNHSRINTTYLTQ